MMDVGRHPNIKLLTNSEVAEVSGDAGDFSVKIIRYPRYVDITRCTACGDCSKVCPVTRPNEFDLGLKSRKAIFSPYNQAVPSAFVRVREDCLGDNPIACGKCLDVCKAQSINFDERAESLTLRVGAIVVATGVEYYDPREASEYGYTRFENVVTSFELERLLDASSPTRGELLTFTHLRPPKRVAFIQCVGSRNIKADINYCSRICCMNTIKDALVIREHYPDTEILVFYIDIRAFGKGFEEFYRRSLDAGIKYIKGKPSKIIEDKKTGELRLAYEDQLTGEIKDLIVDIAVLSSALIPSPKTWELARILGIELDRDGFFKEQDPCSHPLESSRAGIFLAGCGTAPKDITDSIAEACGAAAKAGVLMAGEEIEEKKAEIVPLDLSGEARIGVIVCHCGLNISAVLSIEELKRYSATLPNVVFVDDYLFACAESVQRKIQESIIEHRLNRIVVAACTPKTHEPIFQETLLKIGFNPYLFDMANIRNQCSWVHQREPEVATEKAKEIIRMSVARVKRLVPLEPKILNVGRDIVIIGGGISGMQAALDLADRGFKVHLIEKRSRLGGRVRELANVYPSGKPGSVLIEEIEQALKKKSVQVYTNTEIKNIKGFIGNFEVEIFSQNERKVLSAGAIILAIGADLYKPLDKFGYGEFSNVYTSMELEEILINNFERLK
ncbi:MAG: FAD-dependent oxidoreductase, partial [candidate division WOR-3 bacterium]